MGQQSDRAREALLRSAEELFAVHGIDAVSNRKIVEHAGAANHSAIAYHFGTREDLVRTLLTQHRERTAMRRQELLDELDVQPTVHDIIRVRLLPLVELLESLPKPSWRAQFLAQVRETPAMFPVLEAVAWESVVDTELLTASSSLREVPTEVLRARSAMLAHMVLGGIAEHERKTNAGHQRGGWLDVGYFLIDAAAGLLSAPVTRPGRAPESTDIPLL